MLSHFARWIEESGEFAVTRASVRDAARVDTTWLRRREKGPVAERRAGRRMSDTDPVCERSQLGCALRSSQRQCGAR